jgi:geranylgeranyl pyrophosphate synthase
MSTAALEILKNSKEFTSLFESIVESTSAESVMNEMSDIMASRLYNLGLADEASLLRKHASHHNLKPFFLGYNSYRNFLVPGSAKLEDAVGLLCLGELSTLHIIIFDELMDSHTTRGGEPTFFGHFKASYPAKAEQRTFIASDAVLNGFLECVLSSTITDAMKVGLLKSHARCCGITYSSPVREPPSAPVSRDDVNRRYTQKSHFFVARFMSELGAILGGSHVSAVDGIDEILKRITNLTAIRNDISDFEGKNRSVLEDLKAGSNPLGMYLLSRFCGGSDPARRAVSGWNERELIKALTCNESRNEAFALAIQARQAVKRSVSGRGENIGNYLLYADHVTNGIAGMLGFKLTKTLP